MALCIYTCDCPISVSIHFNINFSHISHRVFDFCHLICPLSYFITQTSWLHCSAWPQKAAVFPSSNVTHFSTCTRFSLSHTDTHTDTDAPWIYRKNLSNHFTWRQFLGPGHLRFLLHVWPIKSALKWGKGGQCLSGTKVNERKCHVVYPIQ